MEKKIDSLLSPYAFSLFFALSFSPKKNNYQFQRITKIMNYQKPRHPSLKQANAGKSPYWPPQILANSVLLATKFGNLCGQILDFPHKCLTIKFYFITKVNNLKIRSHNQHLLCRLEEHEACGQAVHPNNMTSPLHLTLAIKASFGMFLESQSTF